MTKSILLSIKPQWVAKILNGEKTIEVRKLFPKDFKGWVYIYCTKDNNNLLHKNIADIWWIEDKEFQKKSKRLGAEQPLSYNGKVVARFYCDKVEEIKNLGSYFLTWSLNCDELLKNSCLRWEELFDYLRKPLNRGSSVLGYAIHISDLEIFDKPKELREFKANHKYTTCDDCPHYADDNYLHCKDCSGYKPLTKAPQNYCYIETYEPNNL